MIFTRIRTAVACTLLAATTLAPAAERPVIKSHTMQGIALQVLSDNGQWALGWGSEKDNLSPVLIDLTTHKETRLQTESDMQTHGLCLAYDVTDDGNTVVGTYEAKPAYFNRSTGTWTKLPCSMVSGAVHAVTPDGRLGVGTVANADVSGVDYTLEQPVMWDLTTQKVVTPTDLPQGDPDGYLLTSTYVRFVHISPDGRYVVGQVLGEHYFTFVYDRASTDAIKWNFIGYNTTDGKRFTKTQSNLVEVAPVAMSPNGKWLVLDARVLTQGDEYICAARYNMETRALEVYDSKLDDLDMKGGCIDNDGNVYGASPYGSPIREFAVRCDGYWFSLRSILQQHYGTDFDKATGYTNTGTPLGVSADGRTFISMCDPQFGENFTMTTSEALVDVCSGMNLLNNYFIAPTAGATFSKLSQIRITFDREVEVVGDQTAASFGEWNSTSSNGIRLDPTDAKTVVVTFRTHQLEAGQTYTFTLPAGTLCISGDPARTNETITATYVGRANEPVKVVNLYPADGSVLAKIDNSSSPIQLTMDNNVLVTEGASAALYAADGTRLAPLSVASQGNVVQLFPATTQYLFAGDTYTVVLAAGSLTDVSGSGANEELTIHYEGSYEREISTDNATLFSCDFNNVSNSLATWMLYENDHRTPAEFPQSLEFDANNTPWNFSIRDDAGTDICAASHSMYEPAGKSDDWMVTPQLFIPDKATTLTFDAQSLSATAQDALKVVVWACNDVFHMINDATFARLSTEGTVVFDEILSPGSDEFALEGDWQHCTVNLAAYAGKNIYIAFVNQNSAQSMVFVDNVQVTREMPYLLSLSNKQTVVNETSIKIGGTFTVNSPRGFDGGYQLTLCDADGQTIDTYRYTAEGLVPAGDARSFTFGTPLPLTVGENNKFTIRVAYTEGGTSQPMTDEVKSAVTSLTFRPTKRVVLEEMTGTTCGNCPQGIIAIDKMKEVYGEQFIPISIHTYDGDAWGGGLQGYSSYLGLQAAPTAVVNRKTEVLMPMMQDPMTLDYTLTYYGALWMDRVAEELNDPTYVDVTATVKADATGEFSLPLTVRSALNAVNLNLNVFLVFMEDKLTAVQHNYFSSISDPLLGDWGLGGRYGQQSVAGITHNDVVRYVYGASYSGTAGLLPQSMKAGEDYTTTITGELPGTYEVLDNTKFAVLLVDANTDQIVNACLAYVNPKGTGIDPIATVPAAQHAYNLAGQRVGDDYKGIVIVGGKKVVRK
ncbi:MAG: Ig-like domain-containing protein [Bacteroidaceae bacterium]|nr:Ig-like domain-containing protein [Bacteroidaceae bacterium]